LYINNGREINKCYQDDDSLFDKDSKLKKMNKQKLNGQMSKSNLFASDVRVLTKFERLHHRRPMQIIMELLDAMKRN